MDEVLIEKGKIGVIGAGSWGTTLANLLAEKGLPIDLWVFEEELFQAMQEKRENEIFLPGFALSENIRITHSLEEAFTGKNILICAVPSHAVREVFSKGRPHLRDGALIISATKGLEDQSCFTVSQVLRDTLGQTLQIEIACLSGPSFAKEVASKFPTAVTASAIQPETARRAQILLSRPYFRIYTNPDLMGVELGGATKNVMAIAAGTSDGLGFGHSSRSALITRGLAEMTRLGVKMGADARTFFGLAGLGDLVLTCTGSLSRNRTLGLELGKGRKIEDILAGMRMVAEGVRTTKALRALARERKVEMPITDQVYEILYEGKNPRQAVSELMSRNPRSEEESP